MIRQSYSCQDRQKHLQLYDEDVISFFLAHESNSPCTVYSFSFLPDELVDLFKIDRATGEISVDLRSMNNDSMRRTFLEKGVEVIINQDSSSVDDEDFFEGIDWGDEVDGGDERIVDEVNYDCRKDGENDNEISSSRQGNKPQRKTISVSILKGAGSIRRWDVPGNNAIKDYNKHPGIEFYKSCCNSCYIEYESATKAEQKVVKQGVIEAISLRNGRFLDLEGGVLNEKKVLAKIGDVLIKQRNSISSVVNKLAHNPNSNVSDNLKGLMGELYGEIILGNEMISRQMKFTLLDLHKALCAIKCIRPLGEEDIAAAKESGFEIHINADEQIVDRWQSYFASMALARLHLRTSASPQTKMSADCGKEFRDEMKNKAIEAEIGIKVVDKRKLWTGDRSGSCWNLLYESEKKNVNVWEVESGARRLIRRHSSDDGGENYSGFGDIDLLFVSGVYYYMTKNFGPKSLPVEPPPQPLPSVPPSKIKRDRSLKTDEITGEDCIFAEEERKKLDGKKARQFQGGKTPRVPMPPLPLSLSAGMSSLSVENSGQIVDELDDCCERDDSQRIDIEFIKRQQMGEFEDEGRR